MKLTWRIVIRISLLLSVVLAVWVVLFHNALLEEVNDETDDSLEFFSENLIKRVLQGQELPSADNGTNNTYFWEPVSAEYAQSHPHFVYSNEVVYMQQKQENEPARVLKTIFQDSHGGYHLLTVATPTIDTDDLRESLANWIITLYVTLLLLTAAVCMWVLWRTMRPLYRILRWLEASDISKGVMPLVNPTRMGEFVQLNDALVRSVERSEELYRQQKQFTGNASHEIQTPLAVCQNRLDLLLETDLTEPQMGQVIKVQQSLDHISRLNRELLLLAKIDAGQFVGGELVDMGALLVKTAEDCSMIYSTLGVQLTVDAPEPMPVQMDSMLASVLVTNLVRNAFLHNHEQGSVRLSAAQGVLRVANSGQRALDGEHIFERFYQGSKREGSSGLGLAIVKAIAELYHFEIRYSFERSEHIFSIKFR